MRHNVDWLLILHTSNTIRDQDWVHCTTDHNRKKENASLMWTKISFIQPFYNDSKTNILHIQELHIIAVGVRQKHFRLHAIYSGGIWPISWQMKMYVCMFECISSFIVSSCCTRFEEKTNILIKLKHGEPYTIRNSKISFYFIFLAIEMKYNVYNIVWIV